MTENTEQPHAAVVDQRKDTEVTNFGLFVETLLTSPEIANNPAIEDQGQVIVDQFLGALLREGPLKKDDQEMSTVYLLDGIDIFTSRPQNVQLISKLPANATETDLQGLDLDFSDVTRTLNLREAVTKLSRDPRTLGPLLNMRGRIARTVKEGSVIELTMTSLAQIEGYLRAKPDLNKKYNPHLDTAESWVEMIASAAEKGVVDVAKWKELDRLGWSDKEDEHRVGVDWAIAKRGAENAAVNMSLVARSVEKTAEDKQKFPKALGTVSLIGNVGLNK